MYLYNFDFNGLFLFGYSRKSSSPDERQVESIPSQEKFLFGPRRDGSTFGIKQENYYKEQRSAKAKGVRKDFYELLAAIREASKNGKRCGLVSWDLSRLSRNASDSAQIIEMMYAEDVLECIFTFGRIFTNLEEPDILYNEFGRHHSYSHKLGRDVKRGTKDKAERGWYPAAHVPAGYKHHPELKSPGFRRGVDDEIIVDPAVANIIQELDEAMLTGKYTIAGIKALGDQKGLINRRTGKTYSLGFYHRLFLDRFYHEGFTWKGVYYKEAKHKKLRTSLDYERIQKLVSLKAKPNKRPNQGYNFPYNRLLECACGVGMSAARKVQMICTRCKTGPRYTKFSIRHSKSCPKCGLHISKMKNRQVIDHTYYICNKKGGVCKQPSVKAKDIEEQFTDFLSKIEIKKGFSDLMRKYLLAEHRRKTTEHEDLLKSLRSDLAKLEKKVSELIGMKLDKQITQEHFKIHNGRLQKSIEEQKDKIAKVELRVSDWYERALLCLNFGERAAEAFKKKDVEFKRQLILLFSNRIVVSNRSISVSLPKTLFIIKEISENFDGKKLGLELVNDPYLSTDLADSETKSFISPNSRLEPGKTLETKGFEANLTSNVIRRSVVDKVRTAILQDFGFDEFFENLKKSEFFGLESKNPT